MSIDAVRCISCGAVLDIDNVDTPIVQAAVAFVDAHSVCSGPSLFDAD